MRRHVDCAVKGGIALVTMDSPPVNAFTDALHRDFVAVLDELRGRSIRAAIVTGTGAYFQAGGDMNRFLEIHTVPEATAFVEMAQGFANRVAALPYPTIAAINGFALGGGLELALACDIRLASRTATLSVPEVRYGILAGAGGTQRLARLVGPGRAKLLMFTGRRIDSDRALAMGLVDEVVEPDQLLPTALQVAGEIAVNSPVAVRQVKRCVDEGLALPLEQGLALERKYWAELIPHRDYLEGVAAWRQKREPRFPDGPVPDDDRA